MACYLSFTQYALEVSEFIAKSGNIVLFQCCHFSRYGSSLFFCFADLWTFPTEAGTLDNEVSLRFVWVFFPPNYSFRIPEK